MSQDSIVNLDSGFNKPHRAYLITYSQLDHHKFPTRMSFRGVVVSAFGGNNVDYFLVSKEPHVQGGYHYHCAVRLSKPMRWKAAKLYLQEHFDVVVNFSASSEIYIGAYRYVVKNDKDVKNDKESIKSIHLFETFATLYGNTTLKQNG